MGKAQRARPFFDGLRAILVGIADLAPRMILKLRRAGMRRRAGSLELARNINNALAIAERLLDRRGEVGPVAG
jgi:hypothetical protein